MTCLCSQYQIPSEAQACKCDTFVHPEPLQIAAGMSRIPRQIAFFPEYRRAMLADVRTQSALADWRAKEKDNLGLMLLEMWAYVCDNLSFYDEVIAHEAYIRTAMRRPSLRRLVDSLGYLPVPAVAASADLAAFAEDRKAVDLPVGTAFRSGAFDDEGPQVFEILHKTQIHPLTNKWQLEAPHHGKILTNKSFSLLIEQQAEIVEGTRLFIVDDKDASQNQVAEVIAITPHIGQDEKNYTKINFRKPVLLKKDTLHKNLKLFVATQTAVIRAKNSSTVLVLDKQYNLRADDYIFISRKRKSRWYALTEVIETMAEASSTSTITINSSEFELTPIQIPVSQVKLDVGINDASRKAGDSNNWDENTLPELTLHYNIVNAGKVVDEAKTTLDINGPFHFSGIVEKPSNGYNPSNYFFEDKNKEGLLLEGTIKYKKGKLKLGQGQVEKWEMPLTLPVEAYGNVIQAVRGESVTNEILGSGDASQASQAFKLMKKPLTYTYSPTVENDQGVENSLEIYIDGILWTEVPTFFGTTGEDQVYIVRQDDEDDSIITFGDGERGQRVSTGKDNILASYRFGAGAASPPADSIKQIAKPAVGLRSVKNPMPAYGGGDAESSEEIRTYAPKSILTLGRAVSMQDMEAVTMTVPGVRMVQTEWRWDGKMQQPVAKIWYIGDAQLKSIVSKRLHAVTDPSTPIQVVQAGPVEAHLSIDVNIDPRYLEENVIAAIFELLLAPKIGLLLPEKLTIGKPLFRSVIFGAVLSIEGVASIQNISWDGTVFCETAKSPGAGNYFDFEQGTLLINGNSQEL